MPTREDLDFERVADTLDYPVSRDGLRRRLHDEGGLDGKLLVVVDRMPDRTYDSKHDVLAEARSILASSPELFEGTPAARPDAHEARRARGVAVAADTDAHDLEKNATGEDQPVEVPTDHRCMLADLTARLAAAATADRTPLAEVARDALQQFDHDAFAACCMPVYLALAPKTFEQEIQIPVASAEAAALDTRVLLWPVTARDGHHPHTGGWAAVMVERGSLSETETRPGVAPVERTLQLHKPDLIYPEEGVSHHIHNRGEEVGLSIHVFGKQ